MKLIISLVVLLVSLTHSIVSADTLFACVVYGENVPNNVNNKVTADHATLLTKFKENEPPTYKIFAPGQDVSARRDLEVDSERTAMEDAELVKERELLSRCPSACATSGSVTCRSIGCAYCTSCGRRLRALQSASAVENAMNRALAPYCVGHTGCKLWSKLMIVNPDGSMTPAP